MMEGEEMDEEEFDTGDEGDDGFMENGMSRVHNMLTLQSLRWASRWMKMKKTS